MSEFTLDIMLILSFFTLMTIIALGAIYLMHANLDSIIKSIEKLVRLINLAN